MRNAFQHMSDEDLIITYQKSQEANCLGALLHRHSSLLLGIAMKYLADRTLAEDAVQQVFLKCFEHFPKEPIENFKGWLYILMRNYCLGTLAKKQKFAQEEYLSSVASEEAVHQAEWLEKEHTFEQLHIGIAQLSEEQRRCIKLFYLEQKSYKEIMQLTNLSFEQVKSHVQNGKRNLKNWLNKTTFNNE